MKQEFYTAANSYIPQALPVDFPCIFLSGLSDSSSMQGWHFHNCMELNRCTSGEGLLISEQGASPLYAGDFLFISAHTTHNITPSAQPPAPASESLERIFFDPYLLLKDALPEEELDNLLFRLQGCSLVISQKKSPRLHFLMECIFSEIQKESSYYQESLKGLLLSLLMLIKRSSDTPLLSDYQWLYSALNYIRKNYQRKLTIAEIAHDCCGLSESYFRKRFVDIMHISPLDYINRFRIRIACQLIYQTDKPFNKIAEEAGFPTLSGFNRHFHALLGCSPSKWRKQHLTVIR